MQLPRSLLAPECGVVQARQGLRSQDYGWEGQNRREHKIQILSLRILGGAHMACPSGGHPKVSKLAFGILRPWSLGKGYSGSSEAQCSMK